MHIFNKHIDFYTFMQRARRVVLRTMGIFIALFASNRANAYSNEGDFLAEACPGCFYMTYSICDSSMPTDAYDDFISSGTVYYGCLPNANYLTSPQIQDQSCVSKLQQIGLCSADAIEQTGTGLLPNSSLNCASGVTTDSGAYALSFDGATYESYRNYSGMYEFEVIDCGYYGNYRYACCNMNNGTGYNTCYFHCGHCLEMASCGYCDGCVCGYVNVYSIGDISDEVISCSPAFQERFGNGWSTGWCDGNGNIYTDGVAALLINQFCYGDDYIDASGALLKVFCGVVIDSCNYYCGYYKDSNATSDPYIFAQYGSEYYCKQCPTICGYATEHNFSITGGTGHVTSCYATAGTPTITASDKTGTYSEEITGDCPYTE